VTGDLGWSTIGKREKDLPFAWAIGDDPDQTLLWELPMHTSINITGLETYGYHGLFEEERTLGQKFTFDISATLREVRTHRSDNLDSSVRYDAVVDEAVQIAAAGKFWTLEALAETIAVGLLRRFALMEDVTVAVAKSSPPIAHSIEQVSVRVGLRRADLALDQGECSDASGFSQAFSASTSVAADAKAVRLHDSSTLQGSGCR
jgi:dihydroneopterin aldolase